MQQCEAKLLDHLVGECEHFVGNGQPKRLGRREIDDKVEFGRLLDRQIASTRERKF